jgi:uncharacterized protein YjbJ (UPF0337 family)
MVEGLERGTRLSLTKINGTRVINTHKTRNSTQVFKVKVKEGTGKTTGNERLGADGGSGQMKDKLMMVGEKINDAFNE